MTKSRSTTLLSAHFRRTALPLAVSAALVSTSSFAQTLEEVIVTATKRQESVMDVP